MSHSKTFSSTFSYINIFQLTMAVTAIYLSRLACRLKQKVIHFFWPTFLWHKSDLVDFFAPHMRVWVSASHSLSFWPVAEFDNFGWPYKSRCKCRSITIFRFQFLWQGSQSLTYKSDTRTGKEHGPNRSIKFIDMTNCNLHEFRPLFNHCILMVFFFYVYSSLNYTSRSPWG